MIQHLHSSPIQDLLAMIEEKGPQLMRVGSMVGLEDHRYVMGQRSRVLELYRQGWRATAIAEEVGCCEKTVNNYTRHLRANRS